MFARLLHRRVGEPFEGDPRSNLKRILKEMEDMGYSAFNLGPEPEFFLFKLDKHGNPTTEPSDEGGYFDLAAMDARMNSTSSQTFKLVAKTVARRYNLHATFMPKPIYGQPGSGMHFNVSFL